jgi:hypothetical protein
MSDLDPVLDAALGSAFPSNGVSLMAGVDPDHVTTLSGNCLISPHDGEIECDGLAIRLNQPGIASGIGYERIDPVATHCAGSEAAAPPIGVFSFGTLEVAPGARLYVIGEEFSPYALALVAARSVRVHGRLEIFGWAGGFGADEAYDYRPEGAGPSPGAPADGESRAGATGGGAATPGGVGGSSCALAPQLPAQYEPLCGGSTGGMVGNDYGPGYESVIYGVGGEGGGALQISAMESIEVTGTGDCLVSADGREGDPFERGGVGGGAGGTIIIESPSVVVGGDCKVTANGGRGSDVAYNVGGRGGAGGTRDAPAQPGEEAPDDGNPSTPEYGGGGGGAAGFIRVRAASCDGDLAGFSPQVHCGLLP